MRDLHGVRKAELIDIIEHFRDHHGCMGDPWCLHCAVIEGHEPVEDRRAA